MVVMVEEGMGVYASDCCCYCSFSYAFVRLWSASVCISMTENRQICV